MTTYSHIDVKNLHLEESKSADFIAVLSLNRPTAANALCSEMIDELLTYLDELAEIKRCRLLLLRGEGRHFCAGADLGDMQSSAQLSEEDNKKEALKLGQLFLKISELKIPKLAFVKGSAFGGALGLIAACDYALAHIDSRFCLSELRLGLVPALIYPYLRAKIDLSKLNRFVIGGQVFSAQEARDSGLVSLIFRDEDRLTTLKKELDAILSCSPYAQSKYFQLVHGDAKIGLRGLESSAEHIAEVRSLPEAQHGISSFLAKKKPDWFTSISLDKLRSLNP